MEREDTLDNGVELALNAIVSSPIALPPSGHNSLHSPTSALKTPRSEVPLYPSLEEMHTSKVHQSTKKLPMGSPLRNVLAEDSPLRFVKNQDTFNILDTPSKSRASATDVFSPPSFNFKYTRPGPELSEEGRKMMEAVRDQAMKIKATIIAEKQVEERKNAETDKIFSVSGRKLAKPKGRSGRYSNAHMAEFRKMDSIVGHPSLSRAHTGIFSPPPNNLLKRSKSQAKLDEPVGSLTRSKSIKSFHGDQKHSDKNPAKRGKRNLHEDTSSTRPISQDDAGSIMSSPPSGLTRSKSGFPTSAATPTKSSLARAASIKQQHSQIPSLTRSSSTRSVVEHVKRGASNKYQSSVAKLQSMKSMLRRPAAAASNGPSKLPTAHPHVKNSFTAKLDTMKELPSLPSSPSVGIARSKSLKHVEFAPKFFAKYDIEASSSPDKMGPPSTPSKIALPAYTAMPGSKNPVYSPILKKVPLKAALSVPGDFSFRSDKRITFAPSTNFGLKTTGRTIRQVRPSDIFNLENEENISPPVYHVARDTNPLPSIPHGMPNKKKRRRADSDSDEECVKEPQQKKMKAPEPAALTPHASRGKLSRTPILKKDSDAKAGKKGRSFLSLGRLNMLSKPLERRLH
ncbi:MAG: hypothetical protein M1829_000397 [Trizodia sp. TS-e1964]|nr:MAG: hypothetical protein M1829_000397 [Trizodia sp. TS-e1964]